MRRDPEVEALRECIAEVEAELIAEKRDRTFWAVAASRERQRLHRVILDYEQRLGIPKFASAVASNQETRVDG